MADVVTKVYKDLGGELRQCDIYRNVEFVEYVKEQGETIEVSKIVFPLAMVLTQACDLQQDYRARVRMSEDNGGNQDKFLISVIVAPLYNFEEFRLGTHLSQLGFVMEPKGNRKKTVCDNIIKNENKRYHYINFPEEIDLVESVIDFKHYFTVTVNYLSINRESKYVCSVDVLYREQILQRFSNFFSRIGLPNPEQDKQQNDERCQERDLIVAKE